MDKEKLEILEKIKNFRDKSGFSQELLAVKMNISQSKYARFESGKSKTDLDTLEIFCKAINITLKDFFSQNKNYIDQEVFLEKIVNEPLTNSNIENNLFKAQQKTILILEREVNDLRSDKELLKKIIEVKL